MNKLQYERILTLMPGHVYWKDTNCILQGCNEGLAKFLGLKSPNEIKGKTDFDLASKKEAEEIRRFDFEVMKTGNEQIKEETYVLSSGEIATYLSRKAPLYDGSNHIVGIVGISFDITAEKQTKLLKQKQQEAEKKAQYLSIAAGTIAHDLRTPLASIRMMMEAMGNDFKFLVEGYQLAVKNDLFPRKILPQKLRILKDAASRAQHEVDFANTYIDLILGNLKYDSINTANFKVLDMVPVLDDIIKNYPYNDDEQSYIHWQAQEQVNFKFKGDALYLKNIINNLLKNSIHFIHEAGKGEIFIWTQVKDDKHLIHFKDTALGAPKDVVEHMFEGYFSKRRGGTGLGLAFCKSVMESFQGEICAQSKQGEYMQFSLSFPIVT